MENIQEGIFLSIKPRFVEAIVNGIKNHEFRKYKPKSPVTHFWIYTSAPISCLEYLVTTSQPVEYPNQISKPGLGNLEFDNGLKSSIYAFPINSVYKINPHIPLDKLRQFGFTPPQSFSYTKNQANLIEYIHLNTNLTQIL